MLRRCGVMTRRMSSLSRGGPEELSSLLCGAAAGGEGGAEAAEALQWATRPYARSPLRGGPPRAPPPRPRGTVLLFPGQGAQYVGMGRAAADHPAARDLYHTASEVVGWDVLSVCVNGPAGELERRAQTCVLVTALAALERARDERPSAVEAAAAAAGFSAGEIAALVWGGALRLHDALRLAELRAAAMAAAARQRPGGMLAVWLAPAAPLQQALQAARAHTGGHCAVAVCLQPGSRVVAGDEAALRWLEREGGAYGVKRAARVAVAGPYHCELMSAAREPVLAGLRAMQVSAPRAAVWSCTRARPYTTARDVTAGLSKLAQLPVRWEQTLQAVFARPPPHDPPPALALGPARALTHSLRRVNARAADHCLLVEV